MNQSLFIRPINDRIAPPPKLRTRTILIKTGSISNCTTYITIITQIQKSKTNFSSTIYFSQFLSRIKLIIISLNTIPGISRIHLAIAVTGSCVKIPCEISFYSHAITLLKEKLASSISQAISFFGVLYHV